MSFTPFSWRCPFCNHMQAVTSHQFSNGHTHISALGHKHESVGITIIGIACANPDCRELEVKVEIGADDQHGGYWYMKSGKSSKTLFRKTLIPSSMARVFPDYIPAPLLEDYTEACAIRTLSPKASATLSRRILQGMIRDFCGIAKRTLNAEIDALRSAINDGTADRSISIESVDAIDHVRSIGNIGAHMEKDIDTIIPIDDEEAGLLIGLIEMLFEEWYIARHQKQERLTRIAEVAKAKAELKATPSP